MSKQTSLGSITLKNITKREICVDGNKLKAEDTIEVSKIPKTGELNNLIREKYLEVQ